MRQARNARILYGLSLALFGALMFVVFFGSYIMPHYVDRDHRLLYDTVIVDGMKRSVAAPFPPSSEFWLGTDHRGYDILSLLLNGAKYTIGFALAVTVLRFLIAVPLGLLSGATGKGRSVLTTLHLVTSSVPPLLFIFPTMYGLHRVLPPEQRDKILVVLLVVFGIFQIAHQFADRAAHTSERLFITAARMMGASTRRITFVHLWPHLRPELLYAFLTELVQVLFLFGQLAVVYVFIGGGETFEIADATPFSKAVTIDLTRVGEWGGMIAYGTTVLKQYPWIILSAGTFFTAAVLILIFFAKQLQRRLAEPYLFPSRPLTEDGPRLAWIGVTALACLLLLIVGVDKKPPHYEDGYVSKANQTRN